MLDSSYVRPCVLSLNCVTYRNYLETRLKYFVTILVVRIAISARVDMNLCNRQFFLQRFEVSE